METLFADRREEEARLGRADPSGDSAPSGTPMAPQPPDSSGTEPANEKKKGEEWDAPPGEAEHHRPSRVQERAQGRNGGPSRGLAKSYRRDSGGTQQVTDPGAEGGSSEGDVPAWDAPAAAEVPGRHRSSE